MTLRTAPEQAQRGLAHFNVLLNPLGFQAGQRRNVEFAARQHRVGAALLITA